MTIPYQLPINEHVQLSAVKIFNYTFKLPSADAVVVRVNGALQSLGSQFSVTGLGNQSGGTIVFVTAPPVNATILIQRSVPIQRNSDFTRNASLPEELLDDEFDHLTMIAQDQRVGTLTLDANSTFDAKSHRIINVANPVNAQDAATKYWVENSLSSAVVLATTQAGIATTKAGESVASAATALTQAGISTAKAGEASASATSAAASETASGNNASASANSAVAAATSAGSVFGVLADTTAQALAAAGSATAANSSKVAAATSETNAAASAAAALIHKNSASAFATTASDAATASMGYRDQAQAIKDSISGGGSFVTTAMVGAANGVASLDGSGLIPSSQLPSFVDDVLEAANFAALPGTGVTGKIYVTLDTNKTYRWSGSAYVEISASPGSTDAITEGSTNKYYTDAKVRAVALAGLVLSTNAAITASDTVLTSAGKLQKQITDLTATVALKSNTASPTFTGTVSGITPTMIGLSLVDNTSDANKPISTAVQTALNLKANTSSLGTVAALSYPGGTTLFMRADGSWAAPPAGGGGGSSAWGGITGTLADQTDLNSALGAKLNLTGGTLTGKLILPVSTTVAPINFPAGTGVGSPTIGDLWFTGQSFFFRTDSGTSVRIARTDDPSFTGTPIAPTPTAGTNTTQIATTAFVTSAVATSAALQANLAGPTFTGIPNAPTAGAGTNTTQIATTAFVNTAMSSKANLAGAAFTGNVTISAGGSFGVTSRAWTTPSAVTYAATIAVSALLSNVFRLSLTGNVTAFSITNGTDGQTISIRIKQDATGGRTITLASNVKALGTLNTAANRVSILTLTYCSADLVWEGGFVQVAA